MAVYLIIYRVFIHPRWLFGMSEPYQRYKKCWKKKPRNPPKNVGLDSAIKYQYIVYIPEKPTETKQSTKTVYIPETKNTETIVKPKLLMQNLSGLRCPLLCKWEKLYRSIGLHSWCLSARKSPQPHEAAAFSSITVVYGCFLKWWYSQNSPKWSFFSRKTHGCWVPPF